MKVLTDLIVDKLIENDWEVVSVEYTGRNSVIANKKYAKIEITTEECMCHGGRMWISDKHTNNYYEISHDEYDETKGITDSSSELKYIIENEMMDYVNRYSTFVYKLVMINQYGKNSDGTIKENTEYFSDMKSLARRVTDGNDIIEDINTIDKVNTQYPNKDIYCITERINKQAKYSWQENRIWFKRTRFKNNNKKNQFEEDSNFEMYVEIFNK